MLSAAEFARIVLALIALYASIQACRWLFLKARQPPVLGEIVGGLLLGPTLLGAIDSSAQAWLFRSGPATAPVLGLISQLGLMLLTFCAGATIKAPFKPRERKTVLAIAITGLVIPFSASLACSSAFDFASLRGPAATSTSFTLVFAVAMSVTSLPVISRIMQDLGILDTSFAGIVLGVALIEDVILYVILAIALGSNAGHASAPVGLPGVLGLQPGSTATALYHTVVTLGSIWVFVVPVRALYRKSIGRPGNVLYHASPIGYAVLLCAVGIVAFVGLGIEPFFGALLCGYVVGSSEPTTLTVTEIKRFAHATVIPLYFGLIGMKLDLLHSFSVPAFVAVLLFGCAVKALSIYAGARLAGQSASMSLDLAVTMNARGGPGIMVASIAHAAGVINDGFQAILVMIAMVTVLIAGDWLARVPRERLRTALDLEPDPLQPLEERRIEGAS